MVEKSHMSVKFYQEELEIHRISKFPLVSGHHILKNRDCQGGFVKQLSLRLYLVETILLFGLSGYCKVMRDVLWIRLRMHMR